MYIYQVERDLLKRFIKKYAVHMGGKMLDAGSGPAKKYAGLFQKVTQYMTLDINPEFHTDIVGSVDAIPADESSFDGIVCTQVLGDILRPESAIKEFYRILKPRGMILLTEGFMNELHSEPRDFWRFTPYGLRALFEENKFDVIAVECIGGIFSVAAQMFTKYAINSLHLYDHKLLGKIFSKIFFVFGKSAILLDNILQSDAGKKSALNVLVVARKRTV